MISVAQAVEVLKARRDETLNAMQRKSFSKEGRFSQDDLAVFVVTELVELRVREERARILRQFELALHRAHNGRYGLCDGCEGAISEKRLHAIPEASLCIVCAEKVPPRPKAHSFGFAPMVSRRR